MFVSFGRKRLGCIQTGEKTVVTAAIVSMLFVSLFCVGCKKKAPPKAPELESVITNRMNDASYLKALDQNRQTQLAQAAARHVVVTQMQACIKRVKATLKADADEAALKAALAVDREWHVEEQQKWHQIPKVYLGNHLQYHTHIELMAQTLLLHNHLLLHPHLEGKKNNTYVKPI